MAKIQELHIFITGMQQVVNGLRVKTTPESLSVDDQFGTSVEILNDYIFVGSLKGDGNGVDSGSVYIFQYNGNQWQEISLLIHPTLNRTNCFPLTWKPGAIQYLLVLQVQELMDMYTPIFLRRRLTHGDYLRL